mmetsp:Transcript_6587/g.8614  ORF Transcript_6587/g.8614 Transcript_6587/m.8614 type:complete len:205 (+) Transcript_6587:59-673(+)
MKPGRHRRQAIAGPVLAKHQRKFIIHDVLLPVRNREKNRDARIQYSNGTKYFGETFRNKPHGYGVKMYANKDKYEGEWKFGLRHGTGVYQHTKKDKTYTGEWSSNKRDGTGSLIRRRLGNEMGIVGRWVDDRLHGKGTKSYVDGTIVLGVWENGELVRIVENTSPMCKFNGCIRPTDDSREFLQAGPEIIKEIVNTVEINEEND